MGPTQKLPGNQFTNPTRAPYLPLLPQELAIECTNSFLGNGNGNSIEIASDRDFPETKTNSGRSGDSQLGNRNGNSQTRRSNKTNIRKR